VDSNIENDCDCDYNSLDAERGAQEEDDDEGTSTPKSKVPPPPTSGLTSFGVISVLAIWFLATPLRSLRSLVPLRTLVARLSM
jgi:hypothetical protein